MPSPRTQVLFLLSAIVLVADDAASEFADGHFPGLRTFSQVRRKLFSGSHIISKQCEMDFLFYLDNLLNEVSPPDWALRMFDSSTKVPKGVITGDGTDLGVFDECLELRGIKSERGSFNGQHCLAEVTFENEFRVLELKKNISSRHKRMAGVGVPSIGALTVALCVPSTCSADDTAVLIHELVIAFQNMNNIYFGETQTRVNPLQCHSETSYTLRTVDWVAIGVFSFFIILVLLSTVFDMATKSRDSKRNVFTTFSAYTNWKLLMTVKSPHDQLAVLDGMKFITIGWVLLSQRYISWTNVPTDNGNTYIKRMFQEWSYVHITNGNLSGDTFLMINGLLLSYLFFKEVDEKKKFNLPLFYLRRYLRLMPPFGMAVLFYSSVFIHMASGPLWETHAKPMMDNCQADWWANIIYIKNYYKPLSECVSQSWYLQATMQLFLLSPIVLYPLWKSPKIGKCLVILYFLIGLGINFGVAYLYEIRVSVPERRTNIQWDNDYKTRMYYTTHTRFPSWLIGIMTGYMIHRAKKTAFSFALPKVTLIATVIILTFLTIATVLTIYVYNQEGYVYNSLNSAFFHTFVRPGWSAGVALLVFICSTGYGGPVNILLSWKVFAPLTRLVYSMFLTHAAVQIMVTYRTTTVGHLDDTILVSNFLSDMILTIAVAIVWYIVFESPFIALQKKLAGNESLPSSTGYHPGATDIWEEVLRDVTRPRSIE